MLIKKAIGAAAMVLIISVAGIALNQPAGADVPTWRPNSSVAVSGVSCRA
jgi:hypothetical protein